jgi:hypothetical protein
MTWPPNWGSIAMRCAGFPNAGTRWPPAKVPEWTSRPPRGLLQHLPHEAGRWHSSRVDPTVRPSTIGSTRLRVASSGAKDHVREPLVQQKISQHVSAQWRDRAREGPGEAPPPRGPPGPADAPRGLLRARQAMPAGGEEGKKSRRRREIGGEPSTVVEAEGAATGRQNLWNGAR